MSLEERFGLFTLKFFDFILYSKRREKFPSMIRSTAWLVDLLGQAFSKHIYFADNNKIKRKLLNKDSFFFNYLKVTIFEQMIRIIIFFLFCLFE